jgi:hypothetical protein
MRFKNNQGLLMLVAVFMLWGQPHQTLAETRRALLIGINTYISDTSASQPVSDATHSQEALTAGRRDYSNLTGCVNDAMAMQGMLIAKFNFAPTDIHVLLNGQATRAGILAAIQKQLIDDAAPGDTCLLFYAGHGSQVRNLKSNKSSGMDSTLVPADSWQGAMDIRDKELARLFNRALDKGIVLTAVFDSCHSGSIARGLAEKETNRNLAPDPRPISDPPDPGPTPEERGALIISAAQDYDTAGEIDDDDSVRHGAFTMALLKALRSTPPNAPAEEVFLSAQVMLQAEQPGQIPVLAGTSERRQKPFLGTGTSEITGHTIVAVQSCDFDSGLVTLNAGRAIGLEPGCELLSLPVMGGGPDHPATTLQVSSVDGLASSTARVVSGSFKQLKSGDLFDVTRWVYPDAASLRIRLSVAKLSMSSLQKLAPEFAILRAAEELQWVDDPTETTPDHVLSWSESGWTLSGVGDLGKKLKAQTILNKLAGLHEDKPKLFVSLPIPQEMVAALGIADGGPNSAIKIAVTVAAANYLLIGHWRDSQIEYAWIRPNSATNDNQISLLPLRTDWLPVSGEGNPVADAASALAGKALAIGRLKAWLSLDAHGSTSYFPYHLALLNTATGKTKGFGDTIYEGEPYGLVLLADPNAQLDRVQKQRVYVVDIDAWGKTQLVFPSDSQGEVGNLVPYDPTDANHPTPPQKIPLGNPLNPTMFTVTNPYGVDTFLLLTSSEAIPIPSVLDSDGVRTRGVAESNPLQELLGNMGARTRGVEMGVPTDWSIQKLPIKSQAKSD